MAVVAFSGCQQATDTRVPVASPPSERAGDGAPEGPTAAKTQDVTIDLAILDRSEFDAEIATHHGKVVLVDFWATWCGPCLEQLPHTTALARERLDDGLIVFTVCMDDPDDAAKIKRMLASRGADATINLVSRIGGGSKGMEAFEIKGGAVPQYKLYDREGKLWRTIALDPAVQKQFTSDDVTAAVEELLAK